MKGTVMNDFGKDLGLIHEVNVTGRKVGMGSEAYAFLAHNKDCFQMVADLVNHLAVVEYHGIELKPVSMEAVEDFILEMGKIVPKSGCPGCAKKPFLQTFSEGLRLIGLSVVEMMAFCPRENHIESFLDNFQSREKGKDYEQMQIQGCCTQEDFLGTVRKVAQQRNLIVQMMRINL